MVSQIRLLGEQPALLSVGFYFERVPICECVLAGFWGHLCPAVSCACRLPVELNLESQLFLETNAVLTHTPLGKPIRTADPLFPDGKLLRCKVADPKGTGKTPKGPTQIPVRIFIDVLFYSLILSAQPVVAEGFGFKTFLPQFETKSFSVTNSPVEELC